ncbi:piggyBac transposable element-derived protein 4-like [Macrobrachium nipponense]|uniref:piggyBac transposable element-derived protein 4-like n=1 Tax=Macrobrachium nipponense TaxID=159736 RepID=UPI0030C8A2B7
MSHDSFLALDRYFNAFNRSAIPWNSPDHLILVHPVLEYIRERCQFLVVPGKNLSLDEGMKPYKGCLSIKVYNPKKPKKYGMKLFFITQSNTGYIVDFSVYSGVFSTLCDTVFGLVNHFRNQGYHLFMDNYYNSVSLGPETV